MKVKAKNANSKIKEHEYLIGQILPPHNLPLLKLVAVKYTEDMKFESMLQDLAADAETESLKAKHFTEDELYAHIKAWEEIVYDDDEMLTILAIFRTNEGIVYRPDLDGVLVLHEL